MSTQPQVKHVILNAQTRRFDEIDPEECELLPGENVLKLFYCNRAKRFVTIPGPSLLTVQKDLTLAEQR